MTAIARQLGFRYPAQDTMALQGVDLSIAPGALTWLTGRLGSGTSTFLLAASGLAPRLIGGERYGTITIDGSDPALRSPVASGIAYLGPSPSLQLSGIAPTVRAEVAVGPMNAGVERDQIVARVDVAVACFGIEHLVDRTPSQLSGGETQRVILAALHANGPTTWLLDEPFAALDHRSRRALAATLRTMVARGCTVVVASDDADTMHGIADRVVVFAGGRVVLDGSPRELLGGDAFIAHGATTTDAAELGAAGSLAAPRPVTVAGLVEIPLVVAADQRLDDPVTVAPREPILLLAGVTFRYTRGHDVLQGTTLTVRRGDAVGVFGSNGAGKSTLLRLAMALEHPVRGHVDVCGVRTAGLHPEDLAPNVAMLFQQPERQLFAMSVAAECRFGAELAGWARTRIDCAVEAALDAVGLGDVAAMHPGDLPLPRRRLVALASLLVTDPELLLLDEPTAGLDRPSIERVIGVVRRRTARGLTTLAVTHDAFFAHEALERSLVVVGQQVHDLVPADRVFDDEMMAVPAALAMARRWGITGPRTHNSQVATLISRASRKVD